MKREAEVAEAKEKALDEISRNLKFRNVLSTKYSERTSAIETPLRK